MKLHTLAILCSLALVSAGERKFKEQKDKGLSTYNSPSPSTAASENYVVDGDVRNKTDDENNSNNDNTGNNYVNRDSENEKNEGSDSSAPIILPLESKAIRKAQKNVKRRPHVSSTKFLKWCYHGRLSLVKRPIHNGDAFFKRNATECARLATLNDNFQIVVHLQKTYPKYLNAPTLMMRCLESKDVERAKKLFGILKLDASFFDHYVINYILDKPADVQFMLEGGLPLEHLTLSRVMEYSCANGILETVSFMLDGGFDINDGAEPCIVKAISRRRDNIITYLLEYSQTHPNNALNIAPSNDAAIRAVVDTWSIENLRIVISLGAALRTSETVIIDEICGNKNHGPEFLRAVIGAGFDVRFNSFRCMDAAIKEGNLENLAIISEELKKYYPGQ